MAGPTPERSAAVEALAAPYRARPTTRAIIWVGSSLRRWADAHSDLDLRVIVDDEEHAKLSDRDRFIVGIDRGPPRRKAHEILLMSWSQLEGLTTSRRDVVRHAYRRAHMVFDRDGLAAAVVERIARIDPAVRADRLRVHYHEAAWHIEKALLTSKRARSTNAAFHRNLALLAEIRLLFTLAHSWVAPPAWLLDELEDLGLDDPLREDMARALADPSIEHLERSLVGIESRLEREGFAWARSRSAMHAWAALTDEGTAAVERWSTGHC